MRSAVTIRPMTAGDVDAAYRTASAALYESPEEKERLKNRSATEVEHRKARYRHFLEHDPAGAWVAADGERVVGVANALVREGLWVLSLLAVDRGHRGEGVGRALLEGALNYASGTRAAILAASQHPGALRRYARAGFDPHPALAAKGRVLRGSLPAGLGVREGGRGDLELAAAVDRKLRGAAHGPDLDLMLGGGCRLLVSETPAGRGYALEWKGSPALLAATGPAVARGLLWACLERAPAGEEVEVAWITGPQAWAVPVVLDAGLTLSPSGPLFTRGPVGPLAPYLPSGPYL